MPYSLSLRRPFLASSSRGPGRRQHGPDFRAARCRRALGQFDLQRDHVHRGSRNRWRDRNLDMAVADRDVTQHAEIAMVSTGISDRPPGGASQARRRRSASLSKRSPMSPPESSRHRLQFAEEWPRCSLCRPWATLLHPVVLRQNQCRFIGDAGHRLDTTHAFRRLDRDTDRSVRVRCRRDGTSRRYRPRDRRSRSAPGGASSVPSPSRTIHPTNA